jgi:hypothetical protein
MWVEYPVKTAEDFVNTVISEKLQNKIPSDVDTAHPAELDVKAVQQVLEK